jgi:hypothetical protein
LELQNNTSIAHGKHFFRFGARLREDKVSNLSPQNFGDQLAAIFMARPYSMRGPALLSIRRSRD